MPAYILLQGRYFDPDRTAMRAYVERVRPTMAAYGGGYHRVGAQRLEVLEGDWHPRMLTMVKFPTFEQAKAWYDSPEYAPLKAIRHAHARNDVIVVDALEDGDEAYAARPLFSDEEGVRLDAFLAAAARRGVPPDRFRSREPVEVALAAEAAAAPPPAPAAAAMGVEGTAAAVLARVLALLPVLDRAGREQVLARCQALDTQADA